MVGYWLSGTNYRKQIRRRGVKASDLLLHEEMSIAYSMSVGWSSCLRRVFFVTSPPISGCVLAMASPCVSSLWSRVLR